LDTEDEWSDIVLDMKLYEDNPGDTPKNKGLEEKDIFITEMESGCNYQINPLLSMDVWRPDTAGWNDRIEVYGMSGTKYTKDKDYIVEPTMTEEEGDYMLALLKTSITTEDYYIVYFIADRDVEGTDDDRYLKAFVVYNKQPQESEQVNRKRKIVR
jgi:hypothetical protein